MDIRRTQRKDCYDLAVPDIHRFIHSTGVVLHNTGKTTLARLIAKESRLLELAAPNLEKTADLRRALVGLKNKDCLFLDEMHGLRPKSQELLYSAMEDFVIAILDYRRTISPFTLIGATTKFGRLSPPLRDRFDMVFRIDFYSEQDLCIILEQSRRKLELEADQEGLREIAKRARGTPRLANRLLKRVRDYGGLRNWREAFEELGIDGYGLDETDRKFLTLLKKQFRGGPCGLVTLAAAWGEEEITISEVIEPFLLRENFLLKTPRGRALTALGEAALS